MNTGIVMHVETREAGDVLVQDHAASDTTLFVSSVSDFVAAGGQLSIDGQTYTYVSTNSDFETIELDPSTPLLAPYLGEDSVEVLALPSRQVKRALFVQDEGEDGEWAVIPHSLWDKMPDGIREYEDQEQVELEFNEEANQWYIDNILDQEPEIDGSFIDPETVPQPSAIVPTEPPAESPTLRLIGDSKGITVVATGEIEPTTVLDFYLNGVLVDSTTSTVLRRTLDEAGQPMQVNTDYIFHVVARNVVDSAAPSASVTGTLDPAVDEEFIRGVVQAGMVITGAIEVGKITITAPSVEDPKGGIKIPLLDPTTGLPTGEIFLPADGSDANITAHLTAKSLEVRDRLRILGARNVIEGELLLADDVQPPTAGPSVLTTWSDPASYQPHSLPGTLNQYRGLWDAGTSWVTVYAPAAGNGPSIARRIRKSDGAILESATQQFFDSSARGGIVEPGDGYLYLMNREPDYGTGVYRLYRMNWSGTQVSLGEPIGGSNRAAPTIWSDGTYIYSASIVISNGNVEILRAAIPPSNSSNITWTSWKVFASGGHVDGSLTGLYIGNADFGVQRIVVADYYGFAVYDYTNETWVSSQSFGGAGGGVIYGMSWDPTAGRFHSIGTQQRVWKYGKNPSKTTKRITYTWYDSVGTTHESTESPVTEFSHEARQWLRIETGVPAYNPLLTDTPNSVRIYVGGLSNTRYRQPDLGPMVTTAVYEKFVTDTATQPLTNGFEGLSQGDGTIASTSADAPDKPMIQLNGNGSWRLGDLSADTTGKVVAKGDVPWTNITVGAGYAHISGNNGQVSIQNGKLYWRGAVQRTSGTGTRAGDLPAAVTSQLTVGLSTMIRSGNQWIPWIIGANGSLVISSAVATGEQINLASASGANGMPVG